MTPEREQELARDFGLDKVPVPRYDDIPEPNKPSSVAGLVSFKKAVMLVDHLRTAAFQRYLSDSLVIDQRMDASAWSPEHCFAVMIRTDVPPPVNNRITRSTGIKPKRDDPNFFMWLRDVVYEQWTILGAKKMAPPLIFAGGDRKWKRDPKLRAAGAAPFMGVITKYDFTPGVYGATYGVIVPHDQAIADANRMLVKTDHFDESANKV